MFKAKIGNHVYVFRPSLEAYFASYRENTIGYSQHFESPCGRRKLLYADWAASGRLFGPVEHKMVAGYGPFVANTHSESNISGTTMTRAYEEAKRIIKHHVGAGEHDVILFAGSGMTGAVNKLQRMLGLKIHDKLKPRFEIAVEDRPVIFITHMEHHSNHISWAETIGDVVCIPPAEDGSVDPEVLERLLVQYRHRKTKIGAFTACSNVTGFETPYHRLSRTMHEYGGICFVDFSASAPYVDIDMHPASPLEKLDGILFSPHKFLGGPGTSGVLIADSRLFVGEAPDHPGGGTVAWTNPWGEFKYVSDIEAREDGGTPGFLQAIRIALSIKLKEHMGTKPMLEREKELTSKLLNGLEQVSRLHILGDRSRERLGIVSFYIDGIPHSLIVKLLNDRFGIQARGGCSCAGTYGHYLLGIDRKTSKQITDLIDQGDLSQKPGWVRLSVHPIMTNKEISSIVSGIRAITENIAEWKREYRYNPASGEWAHVRGERTIGMDDLFEFKDFTPPQNIG